MMDLKVSIDADYLKRKIDEVFERWEEKDSLLFYHFNSETLDEFIKDLVNCITGDPINEPLTMFNYDEEDE